MGTICEANIVVKCDHSGTHNTFIISREHHQITLRGNIELHREPSSTLELSRRSLMAVEYSISKILGRHQNVEYFLILQKLLEKYSKNTSEVLSGN